MESLNAGLGILEYWNVLYACAVSSCAAALELAGHARERPDVVVRKTTILGSIQSSQPHPSKTVGRRTAQGQAFVESIRVRVCVCAGENQGLKPSATQPLGVASRTTTADGVAVKIESDLTDEAVEFQLTIPCIPARYDTASVGVGEGAAQPLGVATEFEVLTAIFVVSLSLAVVFS